MQSNQRQHYPGLRQAAVMPILCRVVSIGVAVVATPVVLRELGEKGFGLWATLFGVSSMVGIAQQAVCGTALFLAAKHGQEDHRCASKIVTAVLLVAVVTTVGGLVFADITAEFWVQILSETPAEKGVVYAIIPCIAVSAGMLVMSHGLIGLIIGFGRPTTGSVFLAVHQVVFYLVAGTGVILGWGVSALGVTLVVSAFLLLSACWFFFRQSSLGHDFAIEALPFSAWRRWSRYPIAVLVSNGIGVGRPFLDRTIIARFDLGMAASFSLSQQLISVLVAVFGSVSNPLVSMITTANSSRGGKGDRVDQLAGRLSLAIAGVVGALGWTVLFMHRPIFHAWVGRVPANADKFLFIGIIGAVTAITFAGPGVIIAKGLGRPGLETQYAIASIVLLVLLKPVGLWGWGFIGGVAATSLSWGGAAVYMYRLTLLSLGKEWRFTTKLVGIYLLCLCGIVICWVTGARISWFAGRGASLLIVFVYSILVLAVGLILVRGMRSRGIPDQSEQGVEDMNGKLSRAA